MTIWTDLLAEDGSVEFEVAFVDVNGVRTRVLRAGSGPDVVFLHGTTGHLEAFSRNIVAHAREFTVHAIDMLGHGFTSRPAYPYDIARYIEHLLGYMDAAGLTQIHLVGESLGGWVAARLASNDPERVKSLTLVAPGGLRAEPRVMELIKVSTRAAVENDDVELTRKRLELLMFNPEGNVTDELIEVRHRIYQDATFRRALDHMLYLQEMDVRKKNLLREEELKAITRPTLVIWPRQNPFGAMDEGEQLERLIPGSHLVVFDECGHWPQYEHAERFNAEVLGFLRSVETAAKAQVAG